MRDDAAYKLWVGEYAALSLRTQNADTDGVAHFSIAGESCNVSHYVQAVFARNTKVRAGPGASRRPGGF